MSKLNTLDDPKTWDDIRRKSWLGYTWKDRHAKGTPVEMTHAQLRKAKPVEDDETHVYGLEGESPAVQCWELCKPDYWPHLVATFCNFRYKEKGGENGHP